MAEEEKNDLILDDAALGFELVEDDEFDPFAPDAGDLDALAAEEIEDLPVIKEMPENVVKKSVFDASRFDCAEDAIRELFARNPGRRPVLLSIIDLCNNPTPMSRIEELVDQLQQDNFSVYTPMSLCQFLERCGALTCETPENSQTEVDEDGNEYMVIREVPETVWTATEAGLNVLSSSREGTELTALLENPEETVYRPIYERVLAFCAQEGRTRDEVDGIVKDDPLVKKPYRDVMHFLENLETAGAVEWKGRRWVATELGRRHVDTRA